MIGYVILVAIILILVIYIICINVEISNIDNQLNEYNTGDRNSTISISLLSKKLNKLTNTINKSIVLLKKEKISMKKREESLKDVVTNVSHDLRTPLTSITGYLQLMERQQDPEKQKKYLKIISEKSAVLKELVDDFYQLSLTELEKEKISLEQVNFSLTLKDYLDGYKEYAENKNLRLESFIIDDVMVYTDASLFLRILENLVGNMLKYAKSFIEVSLEKEEKNILLFFKNDFDTAIPVDIDRVFDQFYIADESRGNHFSTGIGLYNVKKIIESLDWTIAGRIDDDIFSIVVKCKVDKIDII